jgi:purine nucleosidase
MTLSTTPLILSHDGAVDDLLSLLLACTFEHHTLLGVVVTDADCYVEYGVEASRKILGLAGDAHVPVAASEVRGVNAFPHEWRVDCCRVNQLPILNTLGLPIAPRVAGSGVEFVARLLQDSAQPVTVLELGPLSTLAAVIERYPQAAKNINRIVWMGGALGVEHSLETGAKGNVSAQHAPFHDGSAEWNAFWDPAAVHTVLSSNVPLTMCPLDLTDTVPLSAQFRATLARQRHHPLSDLAGQCYALIAFRTYAVWDVLTTAYLGAPQLFTVRDETVRVETAGASMGRTLRDPSGRSVQVLANVQHQAFWDEIARRWAR